MIMLNLAVPTKVPSETVKTTLFVPEVVGTPLITPVLLFTVIPPGRLVADQVSVSPSRSRPNGVTLKLVPTVPDCVPIGSIVGARLGCTTVTVTGASTLVFPDCLGVALYVKLYVSATVGVQPSISGPSSPIVTLGIPVGLSPTNEYL